jgi:hypothetical protein
MDFFKQGYYGTFAGGTTGAPQLGQVFRRRGTDFPHEGQVKDFTAQGAQKAGAGVFSWSSQNGQPQISCLASLFFITSLPLLLLL